jgi:hypothetical protein
MLTKLLQDIAKRAERLESIACYPFLCQTLIIIIKPLEINNATVNFKKKKKKKILLKVNILRLREYIQT